MSESLAGIEHAQSKTLGVVVMYCTPGHLCPGCVVHHYSQFHGKIFWNKAIARMNLKSDSTSDWTSEFKK